MTDTKFYSILKTTMLKQAIREMKKAHGDQRRVDGTPYIQHPIRVAQTLKDLGAPEFVVEACYLHDVLEDTDATPRDIIKLFGFDVFDIVDALTIRKVGKKSTPLEKKKYYEQIEKGSKRNPWIVIVKLSDRLDNLKTMEKFSREKKLKNLQETKNQLLPILPRIEKISSLQKSIIDFLVPEIEEAINNVIKSF